MKVLTFMFLLISSVSFGQKDTVRFHGMVNARMMLQTGNLEQIGGGGVALLSFGNNTFNTEVGLNYNYVKVNGFNVINDSWNYGMFTYNPNARVYPFIMARYGFAKSFGVNSALATGAGGGVHIVNKSPQNYLNLNVQGSYLNFSYRSGNVIDGLGLEAFLRAKTMLFKEKVGLNWQLLSFVMPSQPEMYGWFNSLRLSFGLTKSIDFTVSHEMVYNEIVEDGLQQLNTTLQVGIAFRQ